MLCHFSGSIPSASDVHPYSAYFVHKKTSEHLIRAIGNDQIKRKSIPALKCSLRWDDFKAAAVDEKCIVPSWVYGGKH